MNIWIILIIFVLLLFFLFVAFKYENGLFLIFALIMSAIMVYELVNSGIEYPSGEDAVITRINDTVIEVSNVDQYETINSFWINALIGVFSIISLALIFKVIQGFD